MIHQSFSRRQFLHTVAMLSLGSGLSQTVFATPSLSGQPTAKSTILFFLSGGASHIDMWDMKPDAPAEYRGPFQPIATSAPGVRLCEHLPLLARQAHHLALVNSVGGTVSTNDHHAGYYYNLTGHVPDPTFLSQGNNRTPYPDDWPCMGAVIGAKRPRHPQLPNFITLPQKEGGPGVHASGAIRSKVGVGVRPAVCRRRLEATAEVPGPGARVAGWDDGRPVDAAAGVAS